MSTNYIDQITDTAGTTHDISEGDSTRIFRATCSTAASTAAKVATLQTSNRNFSLATGVRVAVTFTYGNTAATPTLRVDGSSTGTAKTIAVATSATAKTTGNGTTYNTWGPYETVIFTYDGTYWVNGGSSLSIYNAYQNIGSDVNVTSTAVTAATTNYLVGSTSSTTATGTLSKHASAVMYTTADDSTSGYTQLRLGNTTATTTAGGREGQIRLYGTGATYYVDLKAGAIASSSKTITFPNATGTVALTSDIPTVPTITLNGTATTSPSFYAPTSAGTNGYVLKSNGSGEPSWTSAVLTDDKVKSIPVDNGSTYYLTGSSSSSTVTGSLNKHASIKAYASLDTNTSGYAYISIGNSTASGAAGAKYGYFRLYGSTAYYHELKAVQSYPSANRSVYFPRYAGDMYLTCVPGVVAVGGATTAPVYVKSTGEIAAVTSIPYSLLSGTPAVTEVEIVRW